MTDPAVAELADDTWVTLLDVAPTFATFVGDHRFDDRLESLSLDSEQADRRRWQSLADQAARIDAYYHCPHHPTEGVGAYRVACDCRKPRPGLLLAAARELGIDLARSWMIGDKLCDAKAGEAAGCRTLLVRTGHGRDLPDDVNAVADVAEAVAMLLGERRDEAQPPLTPL